MKRLLYVLVCMLVLCACNNNGATFLGTPDSSVNDSVQSEIRNDSDSTAQANQDQLGKLEVKITNIERSINDIKAQMSKDSTKVETMSKKTDQKAKYSALFTVIIGLVLCIPIVVLFKKIRRLRCELNNLQDRVNGINRFIRLQQDMQSAGTGQLKPSLTRKEMEDILMHYLQKIDARLQALEVKEQSRETPPIAPEKGFVSHTMEHYIYFGVNQGNKFTKELAPSDESVAFKGNKISEKEVEFFPQSWDRIKTFNSLDSVVIIKGSTKGTSMKVIKKGHAIRKSENGFSFWEVDIPVEIKLV